MSFVAVLDVGKTNVKLTVASRSGELIETVSLANAPAPAPPYLHIDTARIEPWVFAELGALCRRHDIGAFVAMTHGSAGGLVSADRLLMPMIDYEAEVPAAVTEEYVEAVQPFPRLGSPLMPGAAHMARQLLWLETEWPDAVAAARWYLGGPQYWAWRLTGGGASELTYLAAQTHFWDFDIAGFSGIVHQRGWERLIAPLTPAWSSVGRIHPELAARHGIPESLEVLCGIHDSSANFYRFQQAGLSDLTLISTGTWIVGLSDEEASVLAVARGFVTRNMDVTGRPLSGILAMGGREFAILSGDGPDARVDPREVARLVARGTMALPSFVDQDGVFPGSAGRGVVIGSSPDTPAARRALALLYVSLLTAVCLERLGAKGTIVLDGSFTKDPLYAGLVQAFHPAGNVLYNTDAYGAASGAALLADHERRTAPAPVTLIPPQTVDIAGLAAYRDRWRQHAETQSNSLQTTGRMP